MNVKSGDLAITVRSYGKNIGKIVEVIGPMGENPFYEGSIWNRGDGFCWLVKGNIIDSLGRVHEYCPAPDQWLRPVSGLPDAEEVKDEKPVALQAD